MSENENNDNIFIRFMRSDNFFVAVVRDIIVVTIILLLILYAFKIIFGLFMPIMIVESGSMQPNIGVGDAVVIKNNSMTDINVHDQCELKDSYMSFGDYGDVIVYSPYGNDDVTPVIHRAYDYVEEGERMWDDGPVAPYDGYITKGDNPNSNEHIDQRGNISYAKPVKDEWIKGVAQYKVPYIGELKLKMMELIFDVEYKQNNSL